jgi:hypothetical protein
MPSIPVTMTWEILRRGRWQLVLAMLGGFALPMILLTALSHDGLSDMQDPSLLNMCGLLTLTSMFTVGSGIFNARDRISRLYVYPLRTSTIVTWRMLPAMIIMSLLMSVGIALLNLICGAKWPLWGPAMFAAVAFACVDAVVWLTEKSIHRLIVGLTILAFGLGLWFRSRYGFIFFGPPHLWSEVSASDALTMLAIAIAAYCVAVFAVSRNRRGEPPISLGIADWLNRTFESLLPASDPKFDSGFRAQCWMEWRRKGWIMPFCVLAALPFGLLGWLIFSRQAVDLLVGFFGGAFILPMIAFAAGGVLGGVDPNDSKYSMGHFLATRPISDADLARAILRTAAQSVLLGWAIWALACAIACVCVAVNGQAALLELRPDGRWWYFPATLILPWVVASMVLSLGLLGRPKLVFQILFGMLGVSVIVPLASKMFLDPAEKLLLWQIVAIALGVFLIVISAAIFLTARRRGLVERPIIPTATIVWAAATVAFLVLRPGTPEPRLIGDILGAGVLTLLVVPFAAAPLALSLNRHR